jgi:hypothetical protein
MKSCIDPQGEYFEKINQMQAYNTILNDGRRNVSSASDN